MTRVEVPANISRNQLPGSILIAHWKCANSSFKQSIYTQFLNTLRKAEQASNFYPGLWSGVLWNLYSNLSDESVFTAKNVIFAGLVSDEWPINITRTLHDRRSPLQNDHFFREERHSGSGIQTILIVGEGCVIWTLFGLKHVPRLPAEGGKTSQLRMQGESRENAGPAMPLIM